MYWVVLVLGKSFPRAARVQTAAKHDVSLNYGFFFFYGYITQLSPELRHVERVDWYMSCIAPENLSKENLLGRFSMEKWQYGLNMRPLFLTV